MIRWVAGGCAAAMVATPALAGPWPQDAGHGQVITQIAPYTSEVRGVDDRGRPTGTGTLYRLDGGPYWEHGLAPRWTVGLVPRLQAAWLRDKTTHQTYTSQGLAELGGFLRYQLHQGRLDTLSVQAIAYTPGVAHETRNLRIAEPNASVGLAASYGIGIPLPRGMSAFASLDAGYRFRFGTAADELRIDGTIGIRPIPRWMLLAQSFSTIGMRNGGPGGTDYSVNKVQFSIVHDLTERHAIQIGYMREIDGRRVSLGQAVLGSFWYRY
ncbi:hypothetical protein JMJ55_19935 [Belnapia sp. T6]|uniref:Uncharacterized protein n=1 Tax=Belnapia mucosa TaxID=2804532 RepID=A0ABS1VA64_9PROT|nr:hypothetical protein [Belnapia mucosa]MBL6457609.1 hypothetical protein [Belnapia mucosa]